MLGVVQLHDFAGDGGFEGAIVVCDVCCQLLGFQIGKLPQGSHERSGSVALPRTKSVGVKAAFLPLRRIAPPADDLRNELAMFYGALLWSIDSVKGRRWVDVIVRSRAPELQRHTPSHFPMHNSALRSSEFMQAVRSTFAKTAFSCICRRLSSAHETGPPLLCVSRSCRFVTLHSTSSKLPSVNGAIWPPLSDHTSASCRARRM